MKTYHLEGELYHCDCGDDHWVAKCPKCKGGYIPDYSIYDNKFCWCSGGCGFVFTVWNEVESRDRWEIDIVECEHFDSYDLASKKFYSKCEHESREMFDQETFECIDEMWCKEDKCPIKKNLPFLRG